MFEFEILKALFFGGNAVISFVDGNIVWGILSIMFFVYQIWLFVDAHRKAKRIIEAMESMRDSSPFKEIRIKKGSTPEEIDELLAKMSADIKKEIEERENED